MFQQFSAFCDFPDFAVKLGSIFADKKHLFKKLNKNKYERKTPVLNTKSKLSIALFTHAEGENGLRSALLWRYNIINKKVCQLFFSLEFRAPSSEFEVYDQRPLELINSNSVIEAFCKQNAINHSDCISSSNQNSAMPAF